MESLKPDFDELDRPGTGRKHAYAGVTPAAAEKRSGSNWLLWLLLLTLAGAGAYALYLQQQVVNDLQLKLNDAQMLADNSQKLAGALEGQLSQTDATLAQSGNEMARALKKMDAQLRQLEKSSVASTVVDDGRLAAIEKSSAVLAQKQLALDSQLATANRSIAQHTVSLGTLSQLSEDILAAQGALSASAAAFETRLGKIDEASAKMSAGADETMKAELAALNSRMDKMDKGLVQLQSTMARQDDQLGETRKLATRAAARDVVSPATMKSLQQQVDSIDATRQQLVQRFVAVDRRLNELSLQLNVLSSQ